MKKLMVLLVLLTGAVAISLAVDFDTQIQPIFDAHCVSCHGGSSPRAGLVLTAGVSFGNLAGVTSTNYAPALRVAPGDLENSVLYNKLEDTGRFGGAMTPLGQIPQEKIDLITTWIAELLPTAAERKTWGGLKSRF